MSLVNLAHVCSHLQNASRARLGTTAIPLTNLHLRLAQQMHRAGFLSSVTIGSKAQPPAPAIFGTHPNTQTTYTETVPAHYVANPNYAPGGARAARDVLAAGDGAAAERETSDPEHQPHIFVPARTLTTVVDEAAVTKESVASRRIWLGMKYWDNRPVIEHMRLVSKPTRRIWAGAREMSDLARGIDWGMVRGCRQVGECLFVTTDRGVLEIRECVERGIGGMLLCRVW